MRSEFLLPYPPSVNGLYANRKGGRSKTKKYTAWIETAGWAIRLAQDRHNRHTGPVKLTILARKPDSRRRDISNIVKAVEDLLVSHRIMVDDSQVQSSTVMWSEELSSGVKVILGDA